VPAGGVPRACLPWPTHDYIFRRANWEAESSGTDSPGAADALARVLAGGRLTALHSREKYNSG